MIFIGGINTNAQPTGGEEAKNQQIVAFIKKNNLAATIIDTHHWKKRILPLFFKILKAVLFAKNKNIYISLSHFSTLKLIRFFNALKISKRNNVHYFVVGGEFHNWLAENKIYIGAFKSLKGIYPESFTMVNTLNELGLTNALRIPNFKSIPQVTVNKTYNKLNFVFLSRISPTKGADLIIEAVNILNTKGLSEDYDVSFYGNFHDSVDNNYKSVFLDKIKPLNNANYKGFLKLNEFKNFNILAQYNVMLFPTYWKGEGYPGVLIDAFIAHLPVIASEWNHNKEIVKHNDNGLIIAPKNADALAIAMEDLIKNKSLLQNLENGAKHSIKDYDIDILLPNIIKPNL